MSDRRRNDRRRGPPEYIETSTLLPQSPTTTQQQQHWFPPRRVRVLPGSALKINQPWLYPAEPREAPPTLSQLLSFATLGADASDLTQQFVYRTVTTTSKSKKESVEYLKKDFSLWVSPKSMVCVRIQLWNVAKSPTNSNTALPLLRKAQAVILVLSLDKGPWSACRQAKRWKTWLQENDNHKPVHVLIVHSNNTQSSSMDNLKAGAMLADVVRELQFEGYSIIESDDVESTFLKIIRHHLDPTGARAPVVKNEIVEAKAVPVYSYDSEDEFLQL